MKRIILFLTISLILAISVAAYSAEISITPKKVNAGEEIQVTVNPGSSSYFYNGHFYKNGQWKGYLKFDCPSKICTEKETASFKTGSNWEEGTYSFVIMDYSINRKVRQVFEVGDVMEFYNNTSFNIVKLSTKIVLYTSPGTNGVYKNAFLYKGSKFVAPFELCTSSYLCYNTSPKKYDHTNLEPGKYKFRVYHRDNEYWEYIERFFEVE